MEVSAVPTRPNDSEVAGSRRPESPTHFRFLAMRASSSSLGDSDTVENGIPLQFSLQLLGAPNCSLLSSLTATIVSGVDVTGQAVVTVSIPVNPTLVGFRFFDQWFCFDAAANALGFTVSNGGAATVGA